MWGNCLRAGLGEAWVRGPPWHHHPARPGPRALGGLEPAGETHPGLFAQTKGQNRLSKGTRRGGRGAPSRLFPRTGRVEGNGAVGFSRAPEIRVNPSAPLTAWPGLALGAAPLPDPGLSPPPHSGHKRHEGRGPGQKGVGVGGTLCPWAQRAASRGVGAPAVQGGASRSGACVAAPPSGQGSLLSPPPRSAQRSDRGQPAPGLLVAGVAGGCSAGALQTLGANGAAAWTALPSLVTLWVRATVQSEGRRALSKAAQGGPSLPLLLPKTERRGRKCGGRDPGPPPSPPHFLFRCASLFLPSFLPGHSRKSQEGVLGEVRALLPRPAAPLHLARPQEETRAGSGFPAQATPQLPGSGAVPSPPRGNQWD